MQKYKTTLIILVVSLVQLTACSSAGSDEPGRVVEAYWQALVKKDDARISSLSCAAFEQEALTTLESFRAVEVIEKDVSCSSSLLDDSSASVKCTGSLIASYGAEDLVIDLSQRTYSAVKEGSDWLMCGEE
jgi:hypothetical protein